MICSSSSSVKKLSESFLERTWNNHFNFVRASLVVRLVKNSPAKAGDAGDIGLIPRLGRSPGEGNGNPLQYSGMENSVD